MSIWQAVQHQQHISCSGSRYATQGVEQHDIALTPLPSSWSSSPAIALPYVRLCHEPQPAPGAEVCLFRQVKASLDNVAGVRIPKFEKVGEGHDTNMALTGLGSGGKAIQVSFLASNPCI